MYCITFSPHEILHCQDSLQTLTVSVFFFQQISESVKERLLKSHEQAGLAFAAYDFLDLGDDVIFLECNACRAAWLWLEMAVGINVSENVARYLLGKEETDAS